MLWNTKLLLTLELLSRELFDCVNQCFSLAFLFVAVEILAGDLELWPATVTLKVMNPNSILDKQEKHLVSD